MAGNRLGPRRYYLYTDDRGTTYSYLTDQDLGEAANATLNDGNPNFPRRFLPRGVFLEGQGEAAGSRKFLICPSNSAAPYTSAGGTSLTIDAETWKIVGRKGEKVSYGGNPDEEVPPAV